MKKTVLTTFLVLILTLLSKGQSVGLIDYEEGSLNGYTLFNPLRSTSIYLVDNCGRKINEWESSYTPGASAILLENGNLLRTASSGLSSNPVFAWGGAGERIQEVDWDGDVIWEFVYSDDTHRMHHDFAQTPDGNLLVLAWELKTEDEAIQAGRDPDLIPDGVLWAEYIIEVEPTTGNIVWEWHMWDHLIQDLDASKDNFGVIADNPQLLDINRTGGPTAAGGKNWLHINSIDYFPLMDQLVINSFFISEFFIIDHSTTTEQAAGNSGGAGISGGDFLYRWGNPQNYDQGSEDDRAIFGAHKVHWIPLELEGGGNIMFFNNGTNRPDGSYSSVDIIVPPVDDYVTGRYIYQPGTAYAPSETIWSYTSSPREDFYSSFLSGAQRLSNGNTLVCSGANGRFFEINEAEEIVWEYINPVINEGILSQGDDIPLLSGRNANIVFRCTRYEETFSGFDNVELSPGTPIELDFTEPYGCEIITGVATLFELMIYPNPAQGFVTIELPNTSGISLDIFDLSGKLFDSKTPRNRKLTIDVSNYPKGVYLIKLGELGTRKFIVK